MRKGLTTLLVILLAVGAMLVSCKAEVGTPADELVAVSFEEGTSRAITATLEAFVKDNLYWKYAAEKADNSGLTSGATESYYEAGAVAVSAGNKGLGSGTGIDYKPYKVPGFSQGLWNFKLWAYKTCTGAGTAQDPYVYSDLVYYGEAKNVSLSRGGENTAHVVVNPVAEGDGYIKIGTITFIPKKDGDTADQLKFIEVTNPDGSAVEGISYDSLTQTYTVPAGIYKVTVRFANASQTIIYGEGYVIATVYAGLETLIGGNLNELITYAQFDADLNPDAVNVQAESAAVTLVLTDTPVKIESKEGAEKQVVANVARSDANAIITEMAAAQAVDTGENTKLKLTLNVDPTDATETTITYEIGMKATLTYTKDTETQTTEKPVTALNNYVVVEIEMSSGLSAVNVRHSGTPMYQCSSKADLDGKDAEVPGYSGFFFYDAAGTLYIKTKNFSPFAISYTAPANYVADVDGVKYGTLAEAVAQVKSSSDEGYPSTVTLLADVALASTVETTKTFTLDLAGYDITAANCRAIHVKEGTLTLTGKGTIAANKVTTSTFSKDSSVIRVGNSGAGAALTIGANVTVQSDYCYGVTIFGTNTADNVLTVNGKIKVTGENSAISGNGNTGLADSRVTINAGAEIYAENEYAIYYPGTGVLTINGGKVTGKGGIEAKGGTVSISGGEIMATAAETSHTPYGNGPSTSGYALAAVENSGYQGPAAIAVTGGLVKGPVVALKDSEASAFDASLALSGGTYTVDPTTYAVEGCQIRKNSDGTWTVLSPSDVARQIAIDAGADPATIVVGYDSDEKMYYALGTLSDDVRYCFYTDESVYVHNAKDYNGWDGESYDVTKYTVGKLIDVDGLLMDSFSSNSTVTTIAFSKNLSYAFKPFEGNTVLSTIDFTNLTVIPERMFYKAQGLVSVTIPDSVTSIGVSAFQECANLEELNLPSNLTVIPKGLVYEATKLSKMEIPSTVVSIGDNAIRKVALTSVTIPAGIMSIGSNAFRDCDSLVEILIYGFPVGATMQDNAFDNVASPYPVTVMTVMDSATYSFIYSKLHGRSSAAYITIVDGETSQQEI